MKRPLRPGTLVNRSELQRMLGVSRQRVNAMSDQLPRPLDVLDDGRTPIWRRADVEKFIADRTAKQADRAQAAAQDG